MHLTDEELTQAQLYSKVSITRKVIETMPLTLYKLMECLDQCFKALSKLQDYDLILAIGNTGSGKSTMLYSLVYGPDELEV